MDSGSFSLLVLLLVFLFKGVALSFFFSKTFCKILFTSARLKPKKLAPDHRLLVQILSLSSNAFAAVVEGGHFKNFQTQV